MIVRSKVSRIAAMTNCTSTGRPIELQSGKQPITRLENRLKERDSGQWHIQQNSK